MLCGQSDEQIHKINNALADYPEKLTIYREEAEGSTNYRKTSIWLPGQETHLVPVSDLKGCGCPGPGEVRNL